MSGIRRMDLMSQVKDFGGIRFGTCRPTDIDFFMEVRDRFFILGELGFVEKRACVAQEKALTRLCKALESAGKDVLLFFGVHNARPGELINTGASHVRKYYSSRRQRWTVPPREISVSELLSAYEQRVICRTRSE